MWKQVFALPKVALSIISLVFRGCGMAATADSLRCIEKQYLKMVDFPGRLVDQLKDNISDEKVFTKLNAIDKFGNDIPEADKWMIWVGEHYADNIKALGKNTRGGNHNAGVYSNTSHTHFGGLVNALPNGRRAGETFASGFAPEMAQTSVVPPHY